MTSTTNAYVGRFAPTPSGPLHFGSLLAAAASYLQARAANGLWLVRMEDIDPPREHPGADAWILEALQAFGFEWHGEVLYQSRRRPAHLEAIERLTREGQAYPCTCSRRELAKLPHGPLGPVYPGYCRTRSHSGECAIRVCTGNESVCFSDALQGRQCQHLARESGDFVIRRRDGLIAYNLAVVVDDALDGITEIVRGVDLLTSTPRQIYLQRLLHLSTPAYMHIPVAMNATGQKLSKRTGAEALDLGEPRPQLLAALRALGLPCTADIAACPLAEIWAWGTANWQPERLRARIEIPPGAGTLAEPENGLS